MHNGYLSSQQRSWLVVRDKQATLAGFSGHRVVANNLDSHSGYYALRFVAAIQGVTFPHLLMIGGFRPVQQHDYQGVLAWEQQATAQDVIRL